LLSIEDLVVGFGDQDVLRGVTLDVEPGQGTLICGAGATGKSTLLAAACGVVPRLVHADRVTGALRLGGRDFTDIPRAQLFSRIGIVFQNLDDQLWDLEVEDVVAAPLENRGVARPEIRARIAELFDELSIGALAGRRVLTLSGGERRMVVLASALAARPELLVLDEPTTGLDPESRRQVWGLVQGLVADGAAVLLTTHHLEEAEELADRVAIMRGGQIVLSGTQAEIAETQPATIRFDLDDDAPRPPVPAGVQVVAEGRRVEWHTRALQPVLAGLLAWAAEHGVVLRTLLARAGSLEQAFLAVADGTDPDVTPEENR
jgi:ABC-type multidrug transport system ATPase subunit